jgi:hypothetical protein
VTGTWQVRSCDSTTTTMDTSAGVTAHPLEPGSFSDILEAMSEKAPSGPAPQMAGGLDPEADLANSITPQG